MAKISGENIQQFINVDLPRCSRLIVAFDAALDAADSGLGDRVDNGDQYLKSTSSGEATCACGNVNLKINVAVHDERAKRIKPATVFSSEADGNVNVFLGNSAITSIEVTAGWEKKCEVLSLNFNLPG